MARFFAFFTLFHLSLTFFRPEVPFKQKIWYAKKCAMNYLYGEIFTSSHVAYITVEFTKLVSDLCPPGPALVESDCIKRK